MIWLAVAIAMTFAFLAGWRYARLSQQAEALAVIANLQALNCLLRTLTSSPDITRSLSELARRIRAIVPCDRVGLALLTDDRQAYTTYTARLDAEGPSPEPAPDLHFARRDTLIDEVVTSREGRVIANISASAARYLDANVLTSARFESLLLVPLVFEGDAIGTLNLVARRPNAFTDGNLDTLRPVAEALAAATGTKRLAHALARHQMADELSDLTFVFANDMNGAVQALIGGCELMSRESTDPVVLSGVSRMLEQARRLGDILVRMQRMVHQAGDRSNTGVVQRQV
jgi:transcriptional regulator with GAF, ATPase, and Fis domain